MNFAGPTTQRFNRRHGKVGHLFQGRFKAILVDRDAYLLEVCRYVELNRVRAQLVDLQQRLSALQGETPLILPTVDYQAVASVVAVSKNHMLAPLRRRAALLHAHPARGLHAVFVGDGFFAQAGPWRCAACLEKQYGPLPKRFCNHGVFL